MPQLSLIEWAAVGLLVVWLATNTLPSTRPVLTSIWENLKRLVFSARHDDAVPPPRPDAGQASIHDAVEAVELLINFFDQRNNPDGYEAALRCGRELFDREDAPNEPK